MTTSARPCDSPAVRNRSIRAKIVYEVSAASGGAGERQPRSATCNARRVPMRLVADRFWLADRYGEAIDLATAERVRLCRDDGVTGTWMAARASMCDRLAGLRHPLLVPLIDYGAGGRGWFEAYAIVPPVRLGPDARRRAVLHLVRFLRAAGVELSAEMAERSVNTAAAAGGRRAAARGDIPAGARGRRGNANAARGRRSGRHHRRRYRRGRRYGTAAPSGCRSRAWRGWRASPCSTQPAARGRGHQRRRGICASSIGCRAAARSLPRSPVPRPAAAAAICGFDSAATSPAPSRSSRRHFCDWSP